MSHVYLRLHMNETSMTKGLAPESHIKGLIFDLDGTLADTMPIHLEAWRRTGEAYNVTITDKMINDRAGTPTIQVIEQLSKLYGWEIDPLDFRIRKNEFYKEVKNRNGKIRPIQHVVDIARTYQGLLPMAIGTGSIKRNAEMALADLGIRHWFKALVTADDVENHKPHPDTFMKCSQLMNLAPDECMVYEDGPMGIEAALAAGMTAVHIETKKVYYP